MTVSALWSGEGAGRKTSAFLLLEREGGWSGVDVGVLARAGRFTNRPYGGGCGEVCGQFLDSSWGIRMARQMGSWGDDAMGVGWRSGGHDALACWAAHPARPFDGAPASADLRQGERPRPRGWIHDRGWEWREWGRRRPSPTPRDGFRLGVPE